jgi:hypothetical protein
MRDTKESAEKTKRKYQAFLVDLKRPGRDRPPPLKSDGLFKPLLSSSITRSRSPEDLSEGPTEPPSAIPIGNGSARKGSTQPTYVRNPNLYDLLGSVASLSSEIDTGVRILRTFA